MNLTGLHLLLTYQCTLECDHCFVWGSPAQSGTMTLPDVRLILRQARDMDAVTTIYFEGGEPFLYYALLLEAVREAAGLGFAVGIVTNAYWAASPEDGLVNLKPFAGLLQDLSISCDLYHSNEPLSRQARNAEAAARELGIPVGIISVAQPEAAEASPSAGQLSAGEPGVMYRGRAAESLASRVAGQPWERFTTCPHEDLREPGRVHLDPLGYVHLCQGISLGNVFQTPLEPICARYDPEAHPITGPCCGAAPPASFGSSICRTRSITPTPAIVATPPARRSARVFPTYWFPIKCTGRKAHLLTPRPVER